MGNIIDILRSVVTNGIFIQALGFLGMFVQIFSMQSKEYKKVIGMTISGELIFGFQLLLLGGITGAATNFAACITNIIYFIRIRQKKSTTVFQVIFGILFVAIGLLTWEGPLSLLVIAAKLVSTVSYGMKDTKIIRRLKLISMPLWLIYDVLHFSIGGMLNDLMVITSTVIGIIRLDIKREEKTES
ncbi:MAG: YgjV family protein [Ruminococcaceae bacterium]|nr:YgjV family protein [Oscillospiraceae bacterium]